MGIPGLEGELRGIPGCVINVSIAELVEKYGKNVVVVDGFHFYGQYVYPKFDWICCGFREMVQEICKFVESFERIGVKLVFFFVEGNLDEGADDCGSKTWRERRSKFLQWTQMFFTKSSQWKNKLHEMKRDRHYYHTPLNALPVVLFTLRHILKCEVHLVYAGDRNDDIASYSRDNNCLAVLAQDTFYVFYRIPRYLSLKELELTKMTTIQYCPDALARHKDVEGHLYPLFINKESSKITSEQKNMLFKIEEKLDECGNTEVVRKKIQECLRGKNIEEVLDLQGLNIENIPNPRLFHSFLFQLLRYKLGFNHLPVYGPFKEWGLIKLRAQELYTSGQMCGLIEDILLYKEHYNECILEDFVDFPPSSEVFQFLRRKLYSILFHEEPKRRRVTPDEAGKSSESEIPDVHDPNDSEKTNVRDPNDSETCNVHKSDDSETCNVRKSDDSETCNVRKSDDSETCNVRKSDDSETCNVRKSDDSEALRRELNKTFGNTLGLENLRKCKMVKEWYASEGGRPRNVISVLYPTNPTLHPGLLLLWNKNNLSLNITDRKWKLFVSCISDHLQWQTLSQLPPTLVVPTVVLYYLFRVVPPKYKTGSWSFLKTWEVEVFLAQAVMLSKIDANSLSRIRIEKINPRVVKLIAFFIYGCHHVRLLIEACGNPISEYDLSVFHFFDGKLFHSFYDRAEWRRNARHLCDQDASIIFEQMKQIIIPESETRSVRM